MKLHRFELSKNTFTNNRIIASAIKQGFEGKAINFYRHVGAVIVLERIVYQADIIGSSIVIIGSRLPENWRVLLGDNVIYSVGFCERRFSSTRVPFFK